VQNHDETRLADIQEPERPAAPQQPAPDNPDAMLEAWQRERAEFRNFKRRVAEERRADKENARGDTVERILPLLDELERALEQVPPDITDHPWVRGIVVARRQLLDAVRDLGVTRVGSEGEEFDPALHEAMSFEPRTGVEQRRINEVHRPGYAMGRRLLRPAQVTVIGPPKDDRSDRSTADGERGE
jgi:molecular chaperone GrpE